MADIKYLLKFGKREHLERLVNGNIYCSNAITFWGIEVIAEFGKANGLVRVEPAEKMPVFCMFAVYEEDCKENDDGSIVINLSDDKKQTIREHFPNADAVAIIPNPEVFIEDIRNSIGTEVKAEKVLYFHIDKGFDTKDGQIAMDMEYMKYLMQDAPPVKIDGKTTYTFYADYAFRVLFCKFVIWKHFSTKLRRSTI